jgi:hypothetical protein
MHPILSRIDDFSRWLIQKLIEYRAIHANTIPQIIRHVLFGMVLSNIFLFFAVMDRASEISRNKSFHSSTWEAASSDTSLFLSSMSFIHVMGVWYFLFHPLEPMYLGHLDHHHHGWNHDSSSSTFPDNPRHQGVFCRRNDLSIGIAVGVTLALGIFLLHISILLERSLWFSGPIRFNAIILSIMDFTLAYLMVKGKEDFIQTQHVWDTHQYQTISDTVLVDEEDNRAVIDTILGYHRNHP